jgi:hypothetical protein
MIGGQMTHNDEGSGIVERLTGFLVGVIKVDVEEERGMIWIVFSWNIYRIIDLNLKEHPA